MLNISALRVQRVVPGANTGGAFGYCGSGFLGLMVGVVLSANLAVAADEPVTDAENAAFEAGLVEAYRALGPDYKPRTEHLKDDGTPVYINRLVHEASPYLLQHAHNPVNWYPWGDEAFKKAEAEDKPIFLSIGYATCHWCHVMERESFESEAIAEQMNEHYISIKVDREQLPDVDATYMTGVQLLTGSGGWPLSTFLQADGKPFHAGTYMPPSVFSDTLTNIFQVWADDRPRITDVAGQLSAAIAESSRLSSEARDIGERDIAVARNAALSTYDDFQGGFGPAPKFTREPTLFFLLDLALRNADTEALDAVDFTLERMAAGGIHDHVGGGFHRYAVDEDWLTPHFEKMLYSQAALSRVYLQAYQLTGDNEHRRTARRLLDYVLREMTSPDGGFYSATDADSEGEEGIFFTWTPEQLVEVLGEEDAKLAQEVWGVSARGNFEGRNILHTLGTLAQVAPQHGLSPEALEARLDGFSEVLLAERIKREPPLTDDKIITEWNGMMITAYAQASVILDKPDYLQAALRAGEFIWQSNRREDGSLWRARFRENSSVDASQADYAFLAEAYVALFDATGDKLWLTRSIELVDAMHERFWDDDNGGYFIGLESTRGAALPNRPKDMFDSATPTGNSVALRVLSRLWYRTGEDAYRDRAQAVLAAFSSYIEIDPSGFGYLLTGVNELLQGEVGNSRFAARGKVRASARVADGNRVEIDINMAPGWHINAAEPLQDYLIGTAVTQPDDSPLADVVFPEPEIRTLGFQRSALSLYEGDVTISAALPTVQDTQLVPTVVLQVQACSDEICLAPESLILNLPYNLM